MAGSAVLGFLKGDIDTGSFKGDMDIDVDVDYKLLFWRSKWGFKVSSGTA